MKIIEFGSPASPADTAGVTTVLLSVHVVVVGGREQRTRPKLLCWFPLDWTISMKASQPHAQTNCVQGCILCLRNKSMWIDRVNIVYFLFYFFPGQRPVFVSPFYIFIFTNVNNPASSDDGVLSCSRQTGTYLQFSRSWGQPDPAALGTPREREVRPAATGATRPGSPERLRPAVTSSGGSQVWSG